VLAFGAIAAQPPAGVARVSPSVFDFRSGTVAIAPAFVSRRLGGPGARNDVLYRSDFAASSATLSYAFRYTGTSSVVDPVFVASDAGVKLVLACVDLSASSAKTTIAGNVVLLQADGNDVSAEPRGRLRTVPYVYRLGHTYRVDALVDAPSNVLTARVYDVALGPQTFDRSVGVPPELRGASFRPGFINAAGGTIAITDFSDGTPDDPPIVMHPVRRAFDYLNYLGYNAGVIGPATTAQSLAFQRYFPKLGVRHVRVSGGIDTAPSINAVARYGIDADVLTGLDTPLDVLRRYVASLRLPPDSIELWNEPNNVRDLPDFARAVRAAFPRTPLWGPSVLADSSAHPSVARALSPALASPVDAWNTHPYAPRAPETTGYGDYVVGCGPAADEDCGWYGSSTYNDNESATLAPGRQGVATEGVASFGTDPARCGHGMVDLATQQAYVQRGLLYGFKLGYLRAYPYKFIDDPNCADGFGSFGIITDERGADGTERFNPKPAYVALAGLDALLADRGPDSATFRPRALAYALAGARADLEELPLGVSDGSYRVVLWTDDELWNFDANGGNAPGAPLPAVNERVTFELARRAAIAVYVQSPGDGAWHMLAHRPNARSIAIDVGPFPLVVDVAAATR
jgi:hypothetical protein